jgi:GTP-binding protein
MSGRIVVSLSTVAIVGRPNVGKSTLFNRLVGYRLALVDETAGVTRDRHYGEAEWLGHTFRLIDTGGILLDATNRLTQAVRLQTECAIAEADLILFVLDAREGVTAADQEIASQLHRAGKAVLLIANKVETDEIGFSDTSLYRLGFGEPYAISAEHGRGVGDVLDAVIAKLPRSIGTPGVLASVQVAIVGRPNVGKSSLINRILGANRLLVDDAPGTTRDAIDSWVQVNHKFYTLIDTAGMRKPRRIGVALEKATVAVALQRIQRCEVAVLMLDALAGIGEQDVRIGTYIERHGKACVIAINKWDALEKDAKTYETFIHLAHEAMPFLAHAPIISVSARSGRRVLKLFPLIDAVLAASKRRVPVAKLNTFLQNLTSQRSAPSYRGKFVQPPTFLCFVNRPEGVAQHYQRYMENQLRHHFGFAGSPLRLYFRKK